MANDTVKVAVITGGSRGIGLTVAKTLAARGGWQIHLIDIKEDVGTQAASSLPNTTFHKANVVNYEELGAAFKSAFTAGGNRLDFVFANAGTIEMTDPRAKSDSIDVPPPPDFRVLDVNLGGCVNTVHLGRHYLNLSPEKGSIVMTSSVAGFWPAYWAPLYTASKFGVIGLMRSVAWNYKFEGIRVNSLSPGAVRTSIISKEAWDCMPEDVFTPIELIAETVLKLADGQEFVDAKGVRVSSEELYGQSLVANGKNVYVQGEPEYCDEILARTIEGTKHQTVFEG
ncbi:Short-chain dehydrogenase reductase 5 [Cytospora mali]|uniref:Short-chain dehydrogenase reductase 5 n=1 Tax=Cytospora mali TaxID=578113 RepID=A0A194V2Z9_CYTMA|nr:Short-chain dehydrogenase reductase 5 [Valsa mali var. pyri (nom. inval.)]